MSQRKAPLVFHGLTHDDDLFDVRRAVLGAGGRIDAEHRRPDGEAVLVVFAPNWGAFISRLRLTPAWERCYLSEGERGGAA